MRDELVKEISHLPENQAHWSPVKVLSYLAADAGLKEKYIWAVNSEQQATLADFLRDRYVRENQGSCRVLLIHRSDNPMRQVADATGARFGGVLSRGLALRGERPRAHLPGHDPLRRTHHVGGPQGELLNPA